MQKPMQSLEDVYDKKVELIEDSQLVLETDAQDSKRQSERTIFHTPTKDFSKQVLTTSLNDSTPSILRRRFRLSSQHPPENIISDPTKVTQTRSFLKSLCAFSAFLTLVEPKVVK